ncbi:MAG: hypothetical protein PWP23_1076 [Candidatus Sumerlaeota bacterium]|nr:hypothetical protein [Candidatus Sumerlaeota bacterium]
MTRLAIVATHPIQYYAPWFRHLAAEESLEVRVFYLWDFGVEEKHDRGFQRDVKWDVPLLDGYAHEFVENVSAEPGTHHFWGLRNPALYDRVARWRPDAVLLTAYNYASLVGFLLRWGSRTPVLFRGDSHRLVRRTGWRETLKRVPLRLLFRRFDAVLAVGRANRRYYRAHGVPSRRIFFSPHAVDNDRFFASGDNARSEARVWRRDLGIPEDHRVVLFAGKFEPKKRPLDLLAAFQRAGLSNASLLFAGSGPLEEELRRQAARVSHVYFAPFQNQSAMPRVYAAASVFVLPSFGPHETWGLAVNEAMCLGVPPIVSTHVGCAADLVKHGTNGLVFEAGSVGALASALQSALASDATLRSWNRRCRARVARYSHRQATAGLLDALCFVETAR